MASVLQFVFLTSGVDLLPVAPRFSYLSRSSRGARTRPFDLRRCQPFVASISTLISAMFFAAALSLSARKDPSRPGRALADSHRCPLDCLNLRGQRRLPDGFLASAWTRASFCSSEI